MSSEQSISHETANLVERMIPSSCLSARLDTVIVCTMHACTDGWLVLWERVRLKLETPIMSWRVPIGHGAIPIM
jgi:hypothetical protein